MEKKYRIKKGERVRVEIVRPPVQSSKLKAQSQPKGIIKTRRDEAYLARRLNRNFINFYDLGQFLVGASFETNGTYFQPAVEPPTESSENLVWDVTNGDLETYFDDLRGSILTTPLEDFLTEFYRIAKGDTDFEKTVIVGWTETEDFISGELQELAQWKDGGLRLSSSQVETLEIYPFAAMYNSDALELGTMLDLKATLTLDYDADSVEFAPSNRMDVFLMPAAILNQVTAVYANGLMTGVDFSDWRKHYDVLNANLQLLPRDLLADYREIFDEFGTLDDYQKAWRIAELIKQFPHARATRRIREVDEVADPTVYTYSTTTFAPGDFPFEDIYSHPDAPTNTTNVFNEDFLFALTLYTATDYDRLKAVIRKNNTWYYIWSTA